MKKIFWVIILVAIIGFLLYLFPVSKADKIPVGNASEKSDFISIDSPNINIPAENPMHIIGKAKGNWFFEGSFPIDVYDSNGNRLES